MSTFFLGFTCGFWAMIIIDFIMARIRLREARRHHEHLLNIFYSSFGEPKKPADVLRMVKNEEKKDS